MSVTDSIIEKLVLREHRNLVFQFFCVFSRFECALKRAGFWQIKRGRVEIVEPAWDKFALKYDHKFQPAESPMLQAACDYYTSHPPRKQILDSGVLGWSEPQFHEREPFLTWLLRMVRCVRNNLFHGGKFPMVPIEDPARNTDLLQHSLTIIDACLQLDSPVAHYFSIDDI